MHKTEFLKAVLYIFAGVIIALIIFTYSGMGEKDKKDSDNGAATSTPTALETAALWGEDSIPKIRAVIGPTFMENKTEESGKFSIYKRGDITGDGIEEALVSLGSGGASTEYFALMQIATTTGSGTGVKLAKFKTREGKKDNVMFVEGSSVTHGQAVELAPSKNAIYAESWNVDQNTDTIECEIEAYEWNKATGLFEYDAALGKSATDNYCKKITGSN